jgi:DTW domain-containing protein YfiP
MRHELCICKEITACRELIEKKKSKNKIHILMHHRERHLTTNTGRLAALSIPGCEIHYRGLPLRPLNCEKLILDDHETLLLYPSDDATVLSEEFLKTISKPINLIVPDGSWRQAFKVAKREESLKNVKKITLKSGQLSKYRLRREPKESGLATFEAIARAWGLIEGAEIQTKLENIFDLMVERTLKSRGTLLQ